jgi:transposase InsO family protein
MSQKTSYTKRELIAMIGISASRYYEWEKRRGIANQHNGNIPKQHWILPQERTAILAYCRPRLEEGYRRLSYMMLDEDIAGVSPSTTYRVLKTADLLNKWNGGKPKKKQGFTQPEKPHEHWHVDISYINILGSIFFLITVLDGASRYVVHYDLRVNMTEYDVEVVIQEAKEKFPNAKPRIISDNGPQFIMGNSNASMAPLSAKKSARTVISQSKTPKNILLYLSSNIIPNGCTAPSIT